MHHAELVVRKLEHIRKPLLGCQFPSPEDFLPVNIVLHRLEGSSSVGGFIHQAHKLAGRNLDFNRRVEAGVEKVGYRNRMVPEMSGSIEIFQTSVHCGKPWYLHGCKPVENPQNAVRKIHQQII
jgi:hypothetical protein